MKPYIKKRNKEVNSINSGIFNYSYNIKRNTGWLKIKVINDIGNILFDNLKSNISSIVKQDFHITVVRGENIINFKHWGKYENCLITFDIDDNIKNNKEYYWVDVKCPFLHLVRKELDLSYDPKYPFHLTIGKKILNK